MVQHPKREAHPRLDAVVGLGANLGHRHATLEAAVEAMRALEQATVVATSALYETAPVGPPQPDFLNAAVRLRWGGSPRSLLDALLAVEQTLGRVRSKDERWGPRSIDLDVLWIAGLQVSEPGLEVPHPRLRTRDFALLPLHDVAPDATDPVSGERFSPGVIGSGIRVAARLWPPGKAAP